MSEISPLYATVVSNYCMWKVCFDANARLYNQSSTELKCIAVIMTYLIMVILIEPGSNVEPLLDLNILYLATQGVVCVSSRKSCFILTNHKAQSVIYVLYLSFNNDIN